ncbi:MAG: beta-ketoacyl-ACP synthase III [Bacillota bacterium]|nr:beta-ketoacyl-ACP synthase III [Bacillota bacterium]
MSFTIIGTGRSVPPLAVKNSDLSKIVETSDEWITSRTGIKERRVLSGETLLDISEKAALAALKNSGTDAKELDLILCTTLQGDYITPSLACMVMERLGAECPAFDINAACSGFIYALDLASSYFETKRAKKILIVSAEHLSKFLDWSDRRTCVLFGDGAGAAVLKAGESLLALSLRAKGNYSVLNIPSNVPPTPFDVSGGYQKKQFLTMNGQEIYKFAVTTVAEDVISATKKAGITADDIDYFLLHQANGRIIDAVRQRMNQPESKFPVNLMNYGNTSSATVPILLDELNSENRFKKGDLIFMSAFGAGLTSGVCIIKWGY